MDCKGSVTSGLAGGGNMNDKEFELMPKIKNGIVIDHVPPDRGNLVYLILFPYISDGTTINIRSNIPSTTLGRKWVFKIEDIIEDKTLINYLAIFGGNDITINEIENYEVVKKYHPKPPEIIEGRLITCPNERCVTNNDYHASQMQKFHLINEEPPTYECHYCGTHIGRKDMDKMLLERLLKPK
jgi:aspartate carbamoyltransferase regulatory subunit